MPELGRLAEPDHKILRSRAPIGGLSGPFRKALRLGGERPGFPRMCPLSRRRSRSAKPRSTKRLWPAAPAGDVECGREEFRVRLLEPRRTSSYGQPWQGDVRCRNCTTTIPNAISTMCRRHHKIYARIFNVNLSKQFVFVRRVCSFFALSRMVSMLSFGPPIIFEIVSLNLPAILVWRRLLS